MNAKGCAAVNARRHSRITHKTNHIFPSQMNGLMIKEPHPFPDRDEKHEANQGKNQNEFDKGGSPVISERMVHRRSGPLPRDLGHDQPLSWWAGCSSNRPHSCP
jgi:hypothetical protein